MQKWTRFFLLLFATSRIRFIISIQFNNSEASSYCAHNNILKLSDEIPIKNSFLEYYFFRLRSYEVLRRVDIFSVRFPLKPNPFFSGSGESVMTSSRTRARDPNFLNLRKEISAQRAPARAFSAISQSAEQNESLRPIKISEPGRTDDAVIEFFGPEIRLDACTPMVLRKWTKKKKIKFYSKNPDHVENGNKRSFWKITNGFGVNEFSVIIIIIVWYVQALQLNKIRNEQTWVRDAPRIRFLGVHPGNVQ